MLHPPCKLLVTYVYRCLSNYLTDSVDSSGLLSLESTQTLYLPYVTIKLTPPLQPVMGYFCRLFILHHMDLPSQIATSTTKTKTNLVLSSIFCSTSLALSGRSAETSWNHFRIYQVIKHRQKPWTHQRILVY